MATSRFVDYLSSGKNIAGVIGGLLGLGLGIAGVGGAFWPVIVAALYGAGALAMPPRTVTLVLESADDEAADLRRQLDVLLRHRGRIPAVSKQALDRTAEMLSGVLTRTDVLTTSPDHLHTINRIINTDLPLSLETYLNLPWWYAAGKRMSGQRNAADELLRQLTLIEGAVSRLATRVYELDSQRMADHTLYLESLDAENELEG